MAVIRSQVQDDPLRARLSPGWMFWSWVCVPNFWVQNPGLGLMVQAQAQALPPSPGFGVTIVV